MKRLIPATALAALSACAALPSVRIDRETSTIGRDSGVAIWSARPDEGPGLIGRGFIAVASPVDGLSLRGPDGEVVAQEAGSPVGVSLAALPLEDSFAILLATAERRAGQTRLVLYRLERGETPLLQQWAEAETDLSRPRAVCMRQWNGAPVAVVIDDRGQARSFRIAATADETAEVEIVGTFAITGRPTGCALDLGAGRVRVSTEDRGLGAYRLADGTPAAEGAPSRSRSVALTYLSVGRGMLAAIERDRRSISVWSIEPDGLTPRGRFQIRDAGNRVVGRLSALDGDISSLAPYDDGLLALTTNDRRSAPRLIFVDWAEVERTLGL